MLVKFKIKGLTNVPSFQEYIQGKAGGGFVYRNIVNKLEYDIVRMFIFDLAGKLKKAGVKDFKVANSPYFLGQTAAFWNWLSDRWRDYVEVEQVKEMKDRFYEAFEASNPQQEEVGDIVWYVSPSGKDRRGRIIEINRNEGYMVISDVQSGTEYTVGIDPQLYESEEKDEDPEQEEPEQEEPKKKKRTSFTLEEAKEIGEQLGLKWDKFSVEEFKKGLDIELEHGTRSPETNITDDDPIKTAKITLAHLNEIPDYNTRLLKMEKEAGK